MQARICGQSIELTPLDEPRGIYSCDLSSVGFGSDCVVKRQRQRAGRHERFSTPAGMTASVDYWLLQYKLSSSSDRVQVQLSPDRPDDQSSTVGQVMPLYMDAGMGRSMDIMLFKGGSYCTKADYLEGKKQALANRQAWAQSRSRNGALQQLAQEVVHGVQVQMPAVTNPNSRK